MVIFKLAVVLNFTSKLITIMLRSVFFRVFNRGYKLSLRTSLLFHYAIHDM